MKKVYLVLVALFIVVMLSACNNVTPVSTPAATSNPNIAVTTAPAKSGDDEIPMAAGATTTGVPDMLKAALDAQKGAIPNGKVAAYRVADQAPKVKSSLADAFKQKGWEDKTAAMGGGAATNAIEQAGGFYIVFQKGGKTAAVVGYPGMMAGLDANNIIYFVISN